MVSAGQRVIAYHYSLKKADGTFVESTEGDEPAVILTHTGTLLPKLEHKLLECGEGDRFSLSLLPADAFGERAPNSIKRVPMKHIRFRGKLRPGMSVVLESDQQSRLVTVAKVGKYSVDVDLNHPLAGEALDFEVEVMRVRPATATEISHGHAHGIEGHAEH